jgi:hypothetical protein
MATNVSFAGTTTSAADIKKALEALFDCANLFFAARESKSIEFQAGVTERMLEMMALLLTRAAHSRDEERAAMFLCWMKQGPQHTRALIKKVQGREVKILAPDDLAMFLECPGGIEDYAGERH